MRALATNPRREHHDHGERGYKPNVLGGKNMTGGQVFQLVVAIVSRGAASQDSDAKHLANPCFQHLVLFGPFVRHSCVALGSKTQENSPSASLKH